jgi:hypothetical protein
MVTQIIEETTEPTTHVVTEEVVIPTHATTPRAYATKKTIFRAYQIIWYILGVIEVLLTFRFILKMIGANAVSGFVAFIYTLSAPFVVPFQGIVRNLVAGTSVFEWSTIIAGIVYAVVAWGIVYLFQLIKPVSSGEVTEGVDNP